MRAPGWLETPPESALARAGLFPLSVLAGVYGLGARLHRALYRTGWLAARALPCPVVSVGSLTAGGSGKTPLAAAVAAGLHARGLRVALASRGYGRAAADGGVEIVSDGGRIRCGPERAGDEPLLLAAQAPGVPVVVARDRYRAGLCAVREFGSELLVLDDGFQHHRLRRDLDLVALDGAAGLGGGHVLPRGPLREPLSALARADAIVVVDGPLAAADEARLAARAPAARRFAVRRVPVGLRPLAGGASEPAGSLRGREVGMLCGIARPSSLRRTLASLGARVVAERLFEDHHRFRPRDLAGLGSERPWVVTEKDAVKIDPRWAAGSDLRVLALAIEGERELVDFVLDRLGAAARPRGAG
jgi:tetraacyldisaccharide 4'-kinase